MKNAVIEKAIRAIVAHLLASAGPQDPLHEVVKLMEKAPKADSGDVTFAKRLEAGFLARPAGSPPWTGCATGLMTLAGYTQGEENAVSVGRRLQRLCLWPVLLSKVKVERLVGTDTRRQYRLFLITPLI